MNLNRQQQAISREGILKSPHFQSIDAIHKDQDDDDQEGRSPRPTPTTMVLFVRQRRPQPPSPIKPRTIREFHVIYPNEDDNEKFQHYAFPLNIAKEANSSREANFVD
ncbi:hypothetical protein CFC21_005455 [Triticum aestivum]|uniref:Uncharacterized protein n=2 Tax=Triticum aestivum TaxID=4565 RepID=A0A3B5YTC4_WHEAT|nr:hypothetical protein CFC21_005455 [Triticum aestivum]